MALAERALRWGGGVALLWVTALACSPTPPEPPAEPAPHRGPILLVTFDALRRDEVGALGGVPGLTPHLDRLVSEASWAGSGIAASSWTVPSMASLFTGFQPWQHQTLLASRARLGDDALTLPEALSELGFKTSGFHSNRWLDREFGYHQGFDVFRKQRPMRTMRYLKSLHDEPHFVWFHILPPHAPYVRHERFLDRLPEAPAELPERVRALDLEPFTDPEIPLPEPTRQTFRALYRLNVANADEILGLLLDAVRRSGVWDRCLVVVTSDHGEEFGEYGQIGHGANLGRVLLEVPLVIKLPRGSAREIAVPEGQPVGLVRLWSTLVEMAGGRGEARAGRAPSLLDGAASPAVLSELYLGNGVNRFSVVEGDQQLLWTRSFAPAEPEYYRARLVGLGGTPRIPLSEPPATLFSRLHRAWETAHPLLGHEAPRLTLLRWDDGGQRPLDDAARRRELAGELVALWRRADAARAEATGTTREVDEETAEALRTLGYVVP